MLKYFALFLITVGALRIAHEILQALALAATNSVPMMVLFAIAHITFMLIFGGGYIWLCFRLLK